MILRDIGAPQEEENGKETMAKEESHHIRKSVLSANRTYWK